MEGKTNFSRGLIQFDGLTWLTLTPLILRQIYAPGYCILHMGLLQLAANIATATAHTKEEETSADATQMYII